MKKYKEIQKLYKNHSYFAKKVGLKYSEDTTNWILRDKSEESFVYYDHEQNKITDKKTLKYIEELVIPPMWSETYISPNTDNHVLVIGQDNAGRNQYLYHEKWSKARNLIKSYKLIIFGNYLGEIRKNAKKYLRDFKPGSYEYTLGAFILITDETLIRVGSEYYLEENDTVGLSVMKKENVILKNSRVYFKFQGKSGKNHKIIITDKKCKEAVKNLMKLSSEFLFSYERSGESYHIKSSHANDFLSEFGTDILSIKDYRTWHASVIFFSDIIEELEKDMDDKSRHKLIIKSFDDAAEKLGNTRAVARASYVHADLVDTIEDHKFLEIYKNIKNTDKKRNLSMTESRFLEFIEFLYQNNFNI